MDSLNEALLRTDPRLRMVQLQLLPRGITDPRVLSAMLEVDRALFVPRDRMTSAWNDAPQPVACGQTISQPYVVARMLELLGLRPGDHVLEVGTGTGYQAALLGHLAERVVTVERHPALAQAARDNHHRLGLHNVEVRVGDGTLGAPDAAPFDAIVVAAAGPEVPMPLCDQLRPEGCMVIPVGTRDRQRLLRITRLSDGRLQEEELDAVVFVPLVGARGWHEESPAR